MTKPSLNNSWVCKILVRNDVKKVTPSHISLKSLKKLEVLSLEQVDERKAVRSKLQAVKQSARGGLSIKLWKRTFQRVSFRHSLVARDARMEKLSNSREESIQKRKQEAIEHKQRTLEMYDQMAKSAPAGGQKVMNINVLRGSVNNESCDSDTMSVCSSISDASGLVSTAPKRDLVEEAIQSRIKAADQEKQRILAAYDAAQKSGPAGTYRVADLRGFKKEDAANFTPPKPMGICTFGSSGGIPVVPKGEFFWWQLHFMISLSNRQHLFRVIWQHFLNAQHLLLKRDQCPQLHRQDQHQLF